MRIRAILEFLLAALIVVSLGALSGWYFFLRGQTQTTQSQDAARGFGNAAPTFGGALGSAYQNALSTFGGAKNPQSPQALPQLWQVDTTPVAGYGFVQSGGATRLYFAERGNGYIFSADPSMQNVARLSNTLMPKTYEAFFSGDGSVVERSLDNAGAITTFVGALSASSSADSLKALGGTALAKNILTIAVSPVSNEVFYLARGSGGGAAGIRASWSGANQKRLFTSGLSDWRLLWLPDSAAKGSAQSGERIVLLESPADGVPGYAYELKKDGSLTSLLRDLAGLTISPRASSTALIYGTSGSGALSLFARVSASSSVVQFPIKTVAEKCVWAPSRELVAYCAVPSVAPSGDFLDGWYRGERHTADAWWRVDVSAGSAHLFYSPESSRALDVENPVMDADGKYIAFTNRADLSLWILRINQ